MKASQLLKLMLIAALPMRAIEDETAGAEPSSTEAGTAVLGESSSTQSSSGRASDESGSTTSSSNSSESESPVAASIGDSPNVATLAASASASGTLSSVPSALPVDGTAAAASSDQLAGDVGNVGTGTSGSVAPEVSSSGLSINSDATAVGSGLQVTGAAAGDAGNTIAAGSAADAQPVTSDTTTAAPAASGSIQGVGEQGNVLGGTSADATTTADVGQQGNVSSGTETAGSVSDGSLTANDSASILSGSQTATADSTGSNSSPSATGDAGNVLAGGAPLVDTTSDSIDEPTDDHPAKPHLAALRRKIESGEAIIMADLLRLIHAIEETL